LHLEGSAAGSLSLLLLVLGPGTAQHLEEVGSSLSHTRVDISFWGLDMVMKVITESLNMRNNIGHALRSKMAGEEDECHVANISRPSVLDSWDTLQFKGSIVPEQHLGSILNGPPSSIDELLNKYLSKYTVGLFTEDSAEDDSNSVVAGLNVDGLLLTVVDRLNFTPLSNSLGSVFGSELGSFLLQCIVLLVGLFEWGGHGIAFQESELESQLVTFLLWLWEVLQVYQNREVVTGLDSCHIVAVLPLENLFSPVLDEIGEASYLDRKEDLGLGLGGRDMESNAVEVADRLVNGSGRGSRKPLSQDWLNQYVLVI
jgi:hypothetical protein